MANYSTKDANYFSKDFSNFFRIPESRYLRESPAWDVYLFLQDMVYRKDEPFFGNKNHYASGIMAKKWQEGKVGTFTTVSEIEKFRYLSKNAVKNALKILVKLGFVFVEGLDDLEKPFDRKGMFYQIGERTKDSSGKFNGEITYLENISRFLETKALALKMQHNLISTFKPKAKPFPINNLRFDGISATEIKKSPKEKGL